MIWQPTPPRPIGKSRRPAAFTRFRFRSRGGIAPNAAMPMTPPMVIPRSNLRQRSTLHRHRRPTVAPVTN